MSRKSAPGMWAATNSASPGTATRARRTPRRRRHRLRYSSIIDAQRRVAEQGCVSLVLIKARGSRMLLLPRFDDKPRIPHAATLSVDISHMPCPTGHSRAPIKKLGRGQNRNSAGCVARRQCCCRARIKLARSRAVRILSCWWAAVRRSTRTTSRRARWWRRTTLTRRKVSPST